MPRPIIRLSMALSLCDDTESSRHNSPDFGSLVSVMGDTCSYGPWEPPLHTEPCKDNVCSNHAYLSARILPFHICPS